MLATVYAVTTIEKNATLKCNVNKVIVSKKRHCFGINIVRRSWQLTKLALVEISENSVGWLH